MLKRRWTFTARGRYSFFFVIKDYNILYLAEEPIYNRKVPYLLVDWDQKTFLKSHLPVKPETICHYIPGAKLDIWSDIIIVTIVPISVGTCDLESLVASGHKKIWRPPAANMGFCEFKDVVAFGNNQLWRPLAAKVKGHHSGLPKKWSL